MDKEKKSRREMYKTIAINTTTSVILASGALLILLLIVSHEFSVSTPSLVVGTVGTLLIFVGGALTSDALGRWGSLGLPHYKIGSLLQSIGLGFTVFALIVK